MSYLRKTGSALGIRLLSAGVGYIVELKSLVDFEIIELILIIMTAAALVLTVYSASLKRLFPYILLAKSGFDAIYIITLNGDRHIAGLIIAANTIFAMVYACDMLMKHLNRDEKRSRFTGTAFTVCFLIPYIAVFASLAAITIAVVFYEVSIWLLCVCLVVNVCIFFKVCFVYVNLLLLTLKK